MSSKNIQDMKRVITTNYELWRKMAEDWMEDRLCTSVTEEDRKISWKLEDVYNNDRDGHNV